MNDKEKKQLESAKEFKPSLSSAKRLVAEMSDILHQDSKHHGDDGLRYFMNAVEGSLDLMERQSGQDISELFNNVLSKYRSFNVRVNLINGEYEGVQVVSDLKDSFDVKELVSGFEDKKIISLGLQPAGANFGDKKYSWSNGEHLQIEVLNLGDQESYLKYVIDNNLKFKDKDVLVLGKDDSFDKIFASLFLQGLIDIDEEQFDYIESAIGTKSDNILLAAAADLDIEKVKSILESKKKPTEKIRSLSEDRSMEVEKVLDNKLVEELIKDLKDELKIKENQDKGKILVLVYKLKNKKLDEFSDELIEELANSKSGIFERIIIAVLLRDGDPIETEDMLVKIFTKGSGDEQARWMIAKHFSTNVPVQEHNQKALQKFYGKGLRRLQKTQWDLSLKIGIEGNYPIINEILEDILLHKKEPRYVYVKMIAVNNAESFFGGRWKEVLQKVKTDDELLKEAIKSKLIGNNENEYKKVDLDISDKKDRIKGALYAFAIGDCIGAPIEIMKKDEIVAKYGEVDDFVEDSNLNIPYGEHTDDTELTLVILESIVRNNGFNLEDVLEEYRKIADRYDYETDIDRHFSHSTLMSFRRLAMHQHPLLSGNNTLGNGGVIRVTGLAVLDMYDDEDDLYKNVEDCCIPSHQSSESIDTAYLTAFVTKYCLETDKFDRNILFDLIINAAKNQELKDSIQKVKQLIEGDADYDLAQSELGTSGKAIPTLSYALFCFLKNSGDFKDLIRVSVNIDGDSDSIGAVAASFYGALHGINAIPKDLINKLKCKDRIESLFE